jgi:hypothetical protein
MDTFMHLKGISIDSAAHSFQSAHTILGIVLVLAGIFAWAAKIYPNRRGLQYIWPSIDLLGSVIVLFYILYMFGADNISSWVGITLRSNELIEHGIIIYSIIIGCVALILYNLGVLKSKHWQLMWGIAVLLYGFLFLMHPQDQLSGKYALLSVQYHHWCGFVGVIAGILYILDLYLSDSVSCFKFLWPAAIMTNGFMWIFYRINPLGFKNFGQPSFFQLAPVAALGVGVTLCLLVMLVGGILFGRKGGLEK